jgi:phosphoglycerol transferase MdoB-like AlkP superfamily enzyme
MTIPKPDKGDAVLLSILGAIYAFIALYGVLIPFNLEPDGNVGFLYYLIAAITITISLVIVSISNVLLLLLFKWLRIRRVYMYTAVILIPLLPILAFIVGGMAWIQP